MKNDFTSDVFRCAYGGLPVLRLLLKSTFEKIPGRIEYWFGESGLPGDIKGALDKLSVPEISEEGMPEKERDRLRREIRKTLLGLFGLFEAIDRQVKQMKQNIRLQAQGYAGV